MDVKMRKSLSVFISYAHEDQVLRDQLVKHLSNLKQQNIISTWDDSDIAPGTEQKAQILERLKTAQIILLLISPNFMASEFCYSFEMKEAMARHKVGKAHVIPILLRPVDWKDAPFAKLEMLPTNAKAVTVWSKRDDAFIDVLIGIRKVLEPLAEENAPSSFMSLPNQSEGDGASAPLSSKPLSEEERRHEAVRAQPTASRMRNKRTQYNPSPPPSLSLEQKTRQNVLENVRRTLNTGAKARIALRFRKILDDTSSKDVYPDDTRITDVYNESGCQLLILGEAGAGKTTLLSEIAGNLLEQAEKGENEPIPVVLDLESWAKDRKPFDQWLVEKLPKYKVLRALGRKWVKENKFVLLLDGLDHLKKEAREGCIRAINEYLDKQTMIHPIVICSRDSEYNKLKSRLDFSRIIVEPLTSEQVNKYLLGDGELPATVRAVVHNDPALGKLLTTPLMLTIFKEVYDDISKEEGELTGTIDEQRQQLLDLYIDHAFNKHKDANARYPLEPKQTISWLTQLAQEMRLHNLTIFSLGELQPDWLPLEQRGKYRRSMNLLIALFIGLLAASYSMLYDAQIPDAAGKYDSLYKVVIIGLIIGLMTGGFSIIALITLNSSNYSPDSLMHTLSSKGMIKSRKVFDWSWEGVVILGLLGGLLGGLPGALNGGLLGALKGGLQGGLVFGLLGGLPGGLFRWLTSHLPWKQSKLTQPEQDPPPKEDMSFLAGMSWTGGVVGGLYGMVLGVLNSGPHAPLSIPYGGLYSALLGGLLGGLLGALSDWLAWKPSRLTQREQYPSPKEDMRRSKKMSLRSGLYGMVPGMVIGGLYGIAHSRLIGGLYGIVLGGLIGGLYGIVLGRLHGRLRGGLYGIVLGGLYSGLLGALYGLLGLYGGLLFVLYGIVLGGLIGGLIGGLSDWLAWKPSRLTQREQDPSPNEDMISLRGGLRGGLLGGLIGGLYGILYGMLVFVLYGMLLGVLYGMLLGVLYYGRLYGTLSDWLAWKQSSQTQREQYPSPNEGIWRSGRNGLRLILVFVLYGMLFGWLSSDLYLGLAFGLCFGLVFGLYFGLGTFIQHYVLRFSLWNIGSLPWNLIPFLDEVVNTSLLRNAGGTYTFMHGLLLEHLAGSDPAEKQERAKPDQSGPSQTERPVSPPSALHICNIPYPSNPFFIGRENLLKQLATSLRTGQPQAISGLGGIGKTQIALEYAYRYKQDYQAVLWAQADTRENLTSSFLTLAGLLHLTEKKVADSTQVVAAVKQWLQTKKGYLLILDTAENLDLLRDFLPANTSGHVLLTTRVQEMGQFAFPLEKVDALPLEQGVLFLLRRANVLRPDASLEQASERDQSVAKAICKELGRLPLALDQAGAYIKETECSLADYHTLYKQRREVLLAKHGKLVDNHLLSVSTTWSLSFQRIDKSNPIAANLLRLCAFLAPDAIPETIIKHGGWFSFFARRQDTMDPIKLNLALAVIDAYSLACQNTEKKTLSVHRLVQEVLKDQMTEKEQRQWAKRVVYAVNIALSSVKLQTSSQYEELVSHAQVAANLIKKYEFTMLAAAYLLYQTGMYLNARTRYQEAEPLFARARAIDQQLGREVGGPFSIQVLNGQYSLYNEQGKYGKAEVEIRQVLKIIERKRFGATAPSLNTLAELCLMQGKYTEAESLLVKVRKLQERDLNSPESFIARVLNTHAELYLMQGKYTEAEPLFVRALAICDQHLREKEPFTTAQVLNNQAELYLAQEKYTEAEPLLVRAWKICEEQLREKEPFITAQILNTQAKLYLMQGKYTEAEPLLVRALAICEEQLREKHPFIARVLNTQAKLYLMQGKYTEAEPLFVRALAICEEQLGKKHPFIAQILNTQAELYLAQGKYTEAGKLLEKALNIRKQCLGLAHLDTAQSWWWLARLAEQQGNRSAAKEWYKQAMPVYKEQLGTGHPDTQKIRREYKLCIKDLGESEPS